MRPAGGARPALQDRAPKLGAVGPALAPRRDEGKCCVFSPVEMFLRRLEGGSESAGCRRNRGRSLERLRPARAHADAREREVAALALELLHALFAASQGSVVFLPRPLPFAGPFLGVEPVVHRCKFYKAMLRDATFTKTSLTCAVDVAAGDPNGALDLAPLANRRGPAEYPAARFARSSRCPRMRPSSVLAP
jgi:hypothetical protein